MSDERFLRWGTPQYSALPRPEDDEDEDEDIGERPVFVKLRSYLQLVSERERLRHELQREQEEGDGLRAQRELLQRDLRRTKRGVWLMFAVTLLAGVLMGWATK